MTNPTLTCERFAETLADFLERDVDETTRATMEAHALECHACGPLLADLRRLRIDAANLPALAPSRDLWAGIAERIETPVVDLSSRTSAPAAARIGRRVSRGAWFGLAAAGLVAITATVTRQLTKRSIDAPATRSVAMVRPDTSHRQTVVDTASRVAQLPDTTVQSAATAAAPTRPTTRLAANKTTSESAAEQTYGAEIAGLLVIYDRRRSQLDTGTVAVLHKNLKIIDDAIAQCRLALRKDPASRFLMQSLNDALDTKVQLLRTATMLPSRT